MCDITGLLAATLLALTISGLAIATVLFEVIARRWRYEDRNRGMVAAPKAAPRRRKKRSA